MEDRTDQKGYPGLPVNSKTHLHPSKPCTQLKEEEDQVNDPKD